MMRQYYAIKRENPDSILLFRMGDFYETFGDDAKIVFVEKITDTITKIKKMHKRYLEIKHRDSSS